MEGGEVDSTVTRQCVSPRGIQLPCVNTEPPDRVRHCERDSHRCQLLECTAKNVQLVGPGLETLCRLTQVEFLPPGLVGNNVTDVSLISLPLTCLSLDSNKLHWNFSDVRARGSLWMPSRSNLNSNRRGLPPSPGWDSAEKNCRLKAIGSDQSAGCWSAKQERQMSLIVGLVQFPVAGSVGAQLNVWRLTLSAALVCLLPTG